MRRRIVANENRRQPNRSTEGADALGDLFFHGSGHRRTVEDCRCHPRAFRRQNRVNV
jgi:hypothetical protein